ncbi:MAG: DUF134 domain-containing protein [Planctomycetota bacterium]
MPRNKTQRWIDGRPPCGLFKPAGQPARQQKPVVLELDGYEALRLADYEGLQQSEVAERLGVSRPTVTRILREARGAVATALSEGRPLAIEGGSIRMRGGQRRRHGHGHGGPSDE